MGPMGRMGRMRESEADGRTVVSTRGDPFRRFGRLITGRLRAGEGHPSTALRASSGNGWLTQPRLGIGVKAAESAEVEISVSHR